MANYTKLNTRLQLKFDTWTNWTTEAAKAFIPLKGEVCIAEIPANTAATGEVLSGKAYLLKVGDGSTKFELLPWVSAPAADVHDWAKLPYDKFTELLNKGTLTYDGKTYTGTSFATDAELEEVDSRLIAHINNKNNPHEVTKKQVGLDNVTNDKQVKAISTSTADHIVAFSGDDGATVKDTGVTVAGLQEATGTAQSKANAAYDLAGQANSAAAAAQGTANEALGKANTNAGEITNIKNGITIVAKASHAAEATNATYADAATNATNDGNGDPIHTTYETVANANEVRSKVSSLESKIERTMHFIGVDSSNVLTDGGKQIPTINGVENYTPAAGDVVMSNGHEFIYTTGNVWERLGQDSEFMLATYKITKDNVADNAGIEQTKIAATLTGNTKLSEDISDLNAAIGALNKTVSDNKSITDTYKSYATIKDDSGTTTTAAVINDELTINGDTKIGVAVTTDKVAISHNGVGEAASRGNKDSTSTAAPAFEGTFTAIDSVSTDATGHVIGVNTKTVTLPSVDDINSNISAIKSFSKVNITKADNTTVELEADGANDTLNVVSGTSISVTGATDTDTMTIAHSNVTRTDPAKATTPTSLNHEGTFTVVNSVTSNAQGHITAVQLKDYKLPAGYDDSGLKSRLSVIEPIVNNKTWKTNTLKVETDKTKLGSLSASDLTIGGTEVTYIIFDCGSASENV